MKKLRTNNPDFSVIFGGDVNVGVSDDAKNGVILTDDETDGYDDTHAILSNGLVDGVTMRSLAEGLGSTFVRSDGTPAFPASGAIDVLYVDGPLATEFNAAKATTSSFGSDHLAVFASTSDGGSVAETGSVAIVAALPNPVGIDEGNETVTLQLTGSNALDISSWRLRDAAGNTYIFPNGTQLRSGNNELTLTQNTMPLNNSGDTIELFDRSGNRRGPRFSYSGNDVTSGQPVG